MLSPFAKQDAGVLHRLFRDPAVRRFLLDDALVSTEWMADEIEASDSRFAASGTGLWSVRLRVAPTLIGFVGFRDFFVPTRLQLLYGLLPDYWGQGLATEVATRVCEHAFTELGHGSVCAAIDTPNQASGRVLERLGMSLEPVPTPPEEDTTFYVLTREAWERRRARDRFPDP